MKKLKNYYQKKLGTLIVKIIKEYNWNITDGQIRRLIKK